MARLLISCPDRPGIVAAVSGALFAHGANIISSDQHSTGSHGGTFFTRVEFYLPDLTGRWSALELAFRSLADEFAMSWRIAQAERRKRLAMFVSRRDHAMLELFWRQRAGDLRADIALVVSNHSTHESTVAAFGVPYHYVPVTEETRRAAEDRELELLAAADVDAVILARYMQVLSPAFIAHYPNRIINIHHGFLPAFAGADPHGAAWARGVKLIGATAHYVTEEVDAGPIIEQDVQRVDHRHAARDLRRLGRYIERIVLARAVEWHVEDRVIVHDARTVVFT